MIGITDQLRNFFARRTLFIALGSPLRISSAPTFFPLLGQPDLRLNKLFSLAQEVNENATRIRIQKMRFVFMGWGLLGSRQVFKPVCVLDIIVGYAFDLTLDQLRRYVFDLFSRHTGINAAAFADGVFQYDRTRGDDGIGVHYRLVHHNGAHANEHLIVKGTPVYDRIVADGDAVSNGRPAFLIGSVNAGSILYVDLIADSYKVHVSSKYGIEPNTAVFS